MGTVTPGCSSGWRVREEYTTQDLRSWSYWEGLSHLKEPWTVSALQQHWRITIKRLRWLGHVIRMDQEAPVKKVFEMRVDVGRRREQPQLRWIDQVEENLAVLGVRNWRRCARSRDTWRQMLRSAVTPWRIVMAI